MERVIYIEPLQKRFRVDLKDANKQKRNRSFSNASNCCGVTLSQKKVCSSCENEVKSTECQRKIVKIGKQEQLIDGQALKNVQEQLEAFEEISLHTFMKQMPKEAYDRFGSLVYIMPLEKQRAEYKELAELLKGRVAIGKGIFRTNEFQVIVEVGDDGVLRVRKMVEEGQRYDFHPEAIAEKLENVKMNDEIIALENEILEKKTVKSFDVKQFKDSRSEAEEKIIEDYVLGGKEIPKVTVQVAKAQDSSEMERLKALASA